MNSFLLRLACEPRQPAEDMAEEPFPVQGIGPWCSYTFYLLREVSRDYCCRQGYALGILVAGALPALAVIRATMYIRRQV